MATIFRKKDLLHFVTNAVQECGWNVIYLNNVHPFYVNIFNESESISLKIIIYNITHGGYPRAANEFRIQFKESELEVEKGVKTLILGYYEQYNVFAGWDLLKHVGEPGYSASFQIKLENLEKASMYGFSPYNKGNGEIAIAFRPDFLVEYVRNLESLHTFGESAKDFKILEEVTEREITPNTEMVSQVSKPRQKTLETISKTQRDNRFRDKVMRAYNNRCAFSGTQLRLIDAAHIVPVSYEKSTDETSNGIALSALYHRAYDKGLVTFNEEYKIVTNSKKIAELKNQNLIGGLDKFLSNLRTVIDVPPSKRDRPNVFYVTTANTLRGW